MRFVFCVPQLIRQEVTQLIGTVQLVQHRTRDRKVACSTPGRSGGRNFFSGVNFLCCLIRCSFHPRVTAVARKRTGHSAESASGRLHLNTHTPLTQRSRSGLTMPLSRHCVGTYQKMSSHAAPQGTHGHSPFSSLSHFGLNLA